MSDKRLCYSITIQGEEQITYVGFSSFFLHEQFIQAGNHPVSSIDKALKENSVIQVDLHMDAFDLLELKHPVFLCDDFESCPRCKRS